MRVFKTSFLVAAVLVTTTSNPVFAEGTNSMTNDQKDVLALIQTMTRSFEKGDIDAVMATYEADQSIAFEPGSPVSDSAQSRQMFEQFRALNPDFSYSGHEVIVEGDIAVHIAPWQMTGTDPEGNQVEGEGLSVAVLRRQADGSWKMVIDNPYGNRLLTSAE
ncbi:YybH family protein [Roseibium sp.]|uniref:YybH family protein n=1 Tax=Roseibium sp. TaxID=1936156 RepID=UPI003BB00967